jgi:hypothetical protein
VAEAIEILIADSLKIFFQQIRAIRTAILVLNPVAAPDTTCVDLSAI